jgi:glycosyltransferase involved in cell wall biosynthesis/2-polyprenyl-3-methyl-5-hydroxy-6-metoxy-1,4-benzoquinol methylase
MAKRKNLRVLHINPGNLYGGVETFLVTLARCRDLCPAMVPEFALCVSGRLEEELRQAGVAVHLLGATRLSRPWTVLRARAMLRQLICRRGRYDVVVCHQPWTQALFAGVVQQIGIPYVAYFHGPNGGGWPERLSRGYRPQLVIAPSLLTLDTVQPLHPDVPGEVLYYPLPVQATATSDLTAEQRITIRTQLKARPEDTVILQASRMEQWKGPDLVLRALGQLKNLPDWRFWLAGGAQRDHELSYLNELKRLAVELGIEDRVQFLGQRTDVPMLMRASDLYCQGNRGPEGFSLAFLEASYCGLPIVTSDLGGAPELIDSSTGILVAPESVPDLAEALRLLITDESRRNALGTRAKAKAVELCNAPKQLRQLSQLFARAAGHNRTVKQSDVSLQAVEVEVRARLSGGTSSTGVYEMVARTLCSVRRPGGTLVDVGCGAGQLWPSVQSLFDSYLGCDVVKYNSYPANQVFVKVDLDTGRVPLPDGTADVSAAVETIEHLENPRAFVRELARLTKPGGWVLVTTPNNLSLLSKLTLVLKNQFNAFQDSCYPAHVTALVETDLKRIASECGLTDLRTAFSCNGRIPGTCRHYPRWASRLFPRALSDNVLILGRKSD